MQITIDESIDKVIKLTKNQLDLISFIFLFTKGIDIQNISPKKFLEIMHKSEILFDSKTFNNELVLLHLQQHTKRTFKIDNVLALSPVMIKERTVV